MFSIDKATGEIRIEDRIYKSGYVTVTYAQADEAHNYGWHRFGRMFNKPDLVTISRPMIGCLIN